MRDDANLNQLLVLANMKSIEFKLPIIEKEFTLSLDNDTQNETICLFEKEE